MRARILVLVPICLLAAACGPKNVYTDADVPELPQLGDVMWAQAQVMDPQFKKIGQTAYSDDEYAALGAAAVRLKLTSARIKDGFSKGPEFNQLADMLATRAGELGDAAQAKDAARSSTALKATKDTCKACHSKFR